MSNSNKALGKRTCNVILHENTLTNEVNTEVPCFKIYNSLQTSNVNENVCMYLEKLYYTNFATLKSTTSKVFFFIIILVTKIKSLPK